MGYRDHDDQTYQFSAATVSCIGNTVNTAGNLMSHARSHRTVLQAKRSASLEEASIPQLLVLGVSWMLVMAVGLMPLVDGVLGHTPSIITPTAITFAVAIGSGIFLRRRLSWIGLMLHIYGQIAVWLSIFVLSLNVVLLLATRT